MARMLFGGDLVARGYGGYLALPGAGVGVVYSAVSEDVNGVLTGVTVCTDLLTYAGVAITDGIVHVDRATLSSPKTWGPADGRDDLWISVDGGPVVPFPANVDRRLDVIESALTTAVGGLSGEQAARLAGDAAAAAQVAAEAALRASGDSSEASTRIAQDAANAAATAAEAARAAAAEGNEATARAAAVTAETSRATAAEAAINAQIAALPGIYVRVASTPPDHTVIAAYMDISTTPPVLMVWNGTAWVAASTATSGGGSGVTAVDNGDGTFTASGVGTTDNGDGTFTLTGSGFTDNGDGTFTIAA